MSIFMLMICYVHDFQMAACDMPSDAERIRRVKLLIENGYLKNITLSHDIHTKHRLKVPDCTLTMILKKIYLSMIAQHMWIADANK